MRFCFIAPGHRSVGVLNGDTRKTGGAEAQIAHLATAFASLGHQVGLVYGDGSGGSAPSVIAGVNCIDAFPSWRRPGSLLAFWAAINNSAADLIYARLPSDFLWILGLYSRLNPRSRFLYALANDRDCIPWRAYSYNRWFHNTLYALGLRCADVLALQHEAQAQLVRPHVNARLVLIPNFVHSVRDEPRKYEETDIDAIWIAQIRPAKQLHIFLEVADKLPHLHFAILGGFGESFDRRTRQDLEQKFQGLENLSFLGAQSFEDVMRFLTRSKVLVNTSNWEGFPNTMLEAWSVGVPVVSLQIDPGGVIQSEAIGLVSRTVATMIRDVQALARMPSLNKEMGEKGLAYMRRAHNLEAVCRAFEHVVPGIQAANVRVKQGGQAIG